MIAVARVHSFLASRRAQGRSRSVHRIGRPFALAMGLLAASVVWAQPQAQTGSAAGNDSAARMILQLQQMREEIRELRGQVESQALEIENLSRRQRDQYLDLDRRLNALASGVEPRMPGTGSAPSAENPVAEGSVASGGESSVQPPPPSAQDGGTPAVAAPEVRPALDRNPEIVTLPDPGDAPVRALREPTAAEQQRYDDAFLALRETRYADAAEGFDSFLQDFPDSTYAPNALYWLGEVYYVTRDFETALMQFETLLERYPDSGKQPDALLKTGFSLYELSEWGRARAALMQVVADFPGTNYARLAENRLRTMRLEGHL